MDAVKAPQNYFKFQILWFKIMGFSIYDSKSSFHELLYRLYSFIFLSFIMYLFIIAEIIDLIVKWGNIDNMTFNLCYLLAHSVGLCKVFSLTLNKEKVKEFCAKLESGQCLPNYNRGGTKEYEIISKAVRRTNFQTYILYTFCTIVVSNRCFYAGFDKGYFEILNVNENLTVTKHYQMMPYTTWFPFDENISPYYEISFAWQAISCLFYGLFVSISDSLIAGFMVHIKAQLVILNSSAKNCIKRAVKEAQAKVNVNGKEHVISISENTTNVIEKLKPEVQQFATVYLKECVAHHQDIISLVETVESEFSNVMLMQFLGSLILICFQLFQLSGSDVKTTSFFSMMCFVCHMLFQLLMYCWNGNEIEVESLETANAIYACDWILCDTQTQKAVILMIQRAQRPLKISAGKFVYLTMETYMNILRASSSYYMVLRSMNE